jgi:hypothetical protein
MFLGVYHFDGSPEELLPAGRVEPLGAVRTVRVRQAASG